MSARKNRMTENTVADPTKYVYVPRGVDTLFETYPLAVQRAAIDIVSKIAAKPEGLRCNVHGDSGNKSGFQGVLRFYGRTGTRGAQTWVWYVVIERLLSKGVVFVSDGHVIGVKAKSYCLTPEWADRPWVRLPDDGKHKPTPVKAPAAPIPPWATYCLQKVVFDLAGAVRFRLVGIGVAVELAQQLSESLDFNAIGAAVEAVAGEVKARQVTDELKPLWKWAVDAPCDDDDALDDDAEEKTCKIGRDPFGLRLHSPVTNLSGDLRRFLSFGTLAPAGSKLVKIDAMNAQVVFLAKLVSAQLDTPDALAFAESAANGTFYEETFFALHGRYPSRTTVVDYREQVKYIDPESRKSCVKHRYVQKTERDAWKKSLMGAWLFSDADVQRDSKAAKAIAKLWPSVDRLVRGEKLNWSFDETGAFAPGGTRSLPRQLQRAESAVWIDALVPALEAERIPCLTIHDAVLVPETHKDRTLEIIETLYRERGMTAKFDSELIAA